MKMFHFDASANLDEAMEVVRNTMRNQSLLRATAAEISRFSSLPVVASESALLGLTRSYPALLEVDAAGELVFAFMDLENALPSRSGFGQFLADHRDAIGIYLTLFGLAPLAFLMSFPALGLGHASTYYDGMAGMAATALGVLALPFAIVTVIGTLSVAAFAYLLPFFGGLLCVIAVVQLFRSEDQIIGVGQFLGFGALGLVILAYWFKAIVGIWKRGPQPLLRDTLRFTSEFLFGVGPSWAKDHQSIVDLLKSNSGVISTGDVMVHFGVNRAEAQRALTRVLLDYGGDIQTTDEGAILYHFPLFAETAPKSSQSELEPPRFFGPRLKWLQIMIWGSFVFGMMTCFLDPKLQIFPSASYLLALPNYNAVISQGFGAWPTLVLGLLFLVRYMIWKSRMRGYHARLPQIELLKRLAESPQGFRVHNVDAQLLAVLGGTVDEEADVADGEWYLSFPDVELEMQVAHKIRAS